MSKYNTSGNLKVARIKDSSGVAVKDEQYSSKAKIREERNYAAHIKVKSFNTERTVNRGTSSGYNNTRLNSIQGPILNRQKFNPVNSQSVSTRINTSSSINNRQNNIQKQQEQYNKTAAKLRNPAYKSNKHNEASSSSDTQLQRNNNIQKQQGQYNKSTTKLRDLAYKNYKQNEASLSLEIPYKNNIIRIAGLQNIIKDTTAINNIIKPTNSRNLSKIKNARLSHNDQHQIMPSPAYSRYREVNNRYTISKQSERSFSRNRFRLIRSHALPLKEEQLTVQPSRYTTTNFKPEYEKRIYRNNRLKLMRSNIHQLKNGELGRPSTRYTTNNIRYSSDTNNPAGKSSVLKRLARKNRIASSLAKVNETVQSSIRNSSSESDDLGNKTIQNTAFQMSKIPSYSKRANQLIKITSESRKNVQGVFSREKSISDIIFSKDNQKKKTTMLITNSFKDQMRNAEGNGDLGVDTVVKTKNAVLKTDKAIRTTKKAVKASRNLLKSGIKSAKWGSKIVRNPVQTAKHLALATKIAFKTMLNPIFIKGALIFGAIAVILFSCIAAISGVTSVYAALTYTSTKDDLNETWKYITELDAEIVHEFETVEKDPKWKHIDEFHYDMKYYPLTSASNVIAYLTAKHDDFKFSEVSEEISSIHGQLYNISYNEWEEEVEECETDEEGEESCDTYTVIHLDVTLDGKPFTAWLDTDGGLDTSQRERYDNTLELGGTVMLAEFSNPFGDEDWFSSINTRFGYKFNPESKQIEMHKGIEIIKPQGTQVKSISSGTVETGVDDIGEYVSVTKKSKKTTTAIKYYYLQNISVTDGQVVKKGVEIGLTGSSLLLTYEINGEPHNPWFYIDGGYGIDLENGYAPSGNAPSFKPDLVTSEGWEWPAQSTNITSPFGYRIHPITGERKLHAGTDIPPITGNDPIQSMYVGIVTFAGYHVTGGNMVVINHGNGIQSKYMHLKSMSVRTGDAVQTSQNIGIMGTTGGSTGVHLHFEIHINGQPYDPVELFAR